MRTIMIRRVGPAALAAAAGAACYSSTQAEAPAAALDPKSWVPLKLVSTEPLTENTSVYRFAFAHPEATSGMMVASCLLVKAAIGSEKPDGSRANVLRPYTPMSSPDTKGFLDLAVSDHLALSVHPPWPIPPPECPELSVPIHCRSRCIRRAR